MTAYCKATRPDGTDFRTGTVDYAAALASGEVVRHPAAVMDTDDAATYFSVSVAEADCTGVEWPCRLFRVEPVGEAVASSDFPSKRCVSALRVVGELPAWRALGPNGREVAAVVERARSLTGGEAKLLDAAQVGVRGLAGSAGRGVDGPHSAGSCPSMAAHTASSSSGVMSACSGAAGRGATDAARAASLWRASWAGGRSACAISSAV